jgi:SPP1 gp7 family putative phage head morphogenesis protein
MQGKARDMAFSVAGVASREQLQGVLDSLKAVQTEGLTFAQWKEKVKSGEVDLSLPDYRLDNIFRTNMQVAYNHGHWQQQQKFKDTRPYLMYDAVNDSRTRPSHLALDNVIRPIGDPFWATHYPPNGYRCRCSTISMTEAQARARGGVTEEPTEGWPKPDKGWDYNPGEAFDFGVEQAKLPRSGGSDQLQKAMEDLEKPQVSPKVIATEEQMREFFGEVDKGSARYVNALIKKLEEREWDASVFTQRKLSATIVDASRVPQGACGLYRNNTVYASPNYPKVTETLAHEVGHHISSTLISLGRRDLLSGVYDEMATATRALDTAGFTEKMRSLLKTGKYSEIEALARKAKIKIPSGYALTNNQEWLAEMFRLYVHTPQIVELSFPSAFRAFETIRTGGVL